MRSHRANSPLKKGRSIVEEDWTEDVIATDLVQGFPRKILCWHFTSLECGNAQIFQAFRSIHLS